MDAIVSIKEKNLEELYNEIDRRSREEKAGHIKMLLCMIARDKERK